MAKNVLILGGARTPMGEYGGALRDLSAIDLGAIAARGALERARVAPEAIDHSVIGNALQTSGEQSRRRQVALKAAFIDKPRYRQTVCGPGSVDRFGSPDDSTRRSTDSAWAAWSR